MRAPSQRACWLCLQSQPSVRPSRSCSQGCIVCPLSLFFRACLKSLGPPVVAATKKPAPIDMTPLDVAGDYNVVQKEHCHCWGHENDACGCAQPGCEYTEQLSLSSPDPKTGVFQVKMHAAAPDCYSGQRGPFDMDVDRCGAVIAGGSWHPEQAFDPRAKDQELDLMLAGNVLGFGGAPPGFQHTLIMRHNITICDTEEFLDGNCTVGAERLVCVERFAYCAHGDCGQKNLDKLSPSTDSFAPPVTATGLNGTYVLSAADSSVRCPPNISVYQFGGDLGLGWAPDDMRMARLSAWLPDKDAYVRQECVSFFTACSGLQFSFERAHVGNFVRGAGGKTALNVYDVLPAPDSSKLALSKCVFHSTGPVPVLIDTCYSQHTTVTVLSVLLALTLLAAGVLLFLCLRYRREYVDTKVSRHYDIFNGIGNPGV